MARNTISTLSFGKIRNPWELKKNSKNENPDFFHNVMILTRNIEMFKI